MAGISAPAIPFSQRASEGGPPRCPDAGPRHSSRGPHQSQIEQLPGAAPSVHGNCRPPAESGNARRRLEMLDVPISECGSWSNARSDFSRRFRRNRRIGRMIQVPGQLPVILLQAHRSTPFDQAALIKIPEPRENDGAARNNPTRTSKNSRSCSRPRSCHQRRRMHAQPPWLPAHPRTETARRSFMLGPCCRRNQRWESLKPRRYGADCTIQPHGFYLPRPPDCCGQDPSPSARKAPHPRSGPAIALDKRSMGLACAGRIGPNPWRPISQSPGGLARAGSNASNVVIRTIPPASSNLVIRADELEEPLRSGR